LHGGRHGFRPGGVEQDDPERPAVRPRRGEAAREVVSLRPVGGLGPQAQTGELLDQTGPAQGVRVND